MQARRLKSPCLCVPAFPNPIATAALASVTIGLNMAGFRQGKKRFSQYRPIARPHQALRQPDALFLMVYRVAGLLRK